MSFRLPFVPANKIFARVQVCSWDGRPWSEQELRQKPVEAFFQFPKGRIKWNGKSFQKPDQSNALMHGFVPLPVLLDTHWFVFYHKVPTGAPALRQ